MLVDQFYDNPDAYYEYFYDEEDPGFPITESPKVFCRDCGELVPWVQLPSGKWFPAEHGCKKTRLMQLLPDLD